MKQGLIYKYTSPSGKSYIGQTSDENWRMKCHKSSNCKTKFNSAIKKYGFENFTYEILFKTSFTKDLEKLKDVLNQMEIAFIEYYNSFNNGYNLTKGREGALGVKLSQDALEKCKNTRRLKNPTWGDKLLVIDATIKREAANIRRQEKLRQLEKRRRPRILQYDLNFNLITKWQTLSDINKCLGLCENGIRTCCREKRLNYKSYIWRYEEKEKNEKL